jgi:hypothetical protein
MAKAKTPLSDAERARRAEERLTNKFEKAALGTSKMFAQSLHDIRGAYADKRESLIAIFDEAKETKKTRNEWMFAPVEWGILSLGLALPIIIPLGIFKAITKQMHLSNLKTEVKRELDIYRNAEPKAETATTAASEDKGPFKTRIKSASLK